jgi:hypothetical protein
MLRSDLDKAAMRARLELLARLLVDVRTACTVVSGR